MRLFDDGERDYMGPANEAESQWSFLNRSGWPYFVAAREVIEEWFSRYPSDASKQLRARLQKADDVLHVSAFWELYLHELLTRLGCKLEIEPPLSTENPRRLDFLVAPPQGKPFYVEAVVARSDTPAGRAARARRAAFFDVLNRMSTPDFSLDVQLVGELTGPVKVSPIRSELKRLLRGVDHSALTQQFDAVDATATPSWSWEVPGSTLTIRPLPRGPKMKGRLDLRAIGIYPTRAHWVDAQAYLHKSLSVKARKYGQELGAPYIIAVNAVGDRPELEDVAEVLFGRRRDAAGFGVSGLFSPAHHTHVTAVLVASMVTTSTFPQSDGRLWVNPWADWPLPAALDPLSRMERVDGSQLERAGLPLHAILGNQMQQLEELRWLRH